MSRWRSLPARGQIGEATVAERTQWEYRVESFFNVESDRMQNTLNQLGADGWELVSMASTVKKIAAVGNELRCVLKRQGVGQFVDRDAGWG